MEGTQYALDIIDSKHDRTERRLWLVIAALIGALVVSAFAPARRK